MIILDILLLVCVVAAYFFGVSKGYELRSKDEEYHVPIAYKIVKEIEWVGDDIFEWCAYCGESRIDGHSKSCKLNIFLHGLKKDSKNEKGE